MYNSDQAQIFVRESEEASKSSEANSFSFSRLLTVLALFTITPTFHSDDCAHLWPTQDIDVSQSSGNEGAVKHPQKNIIIAFNLNSVNPGIESTEVSPIKLVACSRRSDSREREKNSRREKKIVFPVYNLTRSSPSAALCYLNAWNRLSNWLIKC